MAYSSPKERKVRKYGKVETRDEPRKTASSYGIRDVFEPAVLESVHLEWFKWGDEYLKESDGIFLVIGEPVEWKVTITGIDELANPPVTTTEVIKL